MADKRLDYYPIISFFLFWFFVCVVGSLINGNPYLFAMGFVSLPTVGIMIYCFNKVRKSHREKKV